MLSLVVYLLVDVIVKGSIGQCDPSDPLFVLYNYAGLGAGMLCSFVQMILDRRKGKKDTTRGYLWDIALVAVFWAIDYICSQIDGGKGLQGILYSLFALILFAFSGWGKVDLLSKMMGNVLDKVMMNPYVKYLMRNTMRRMSYFALFALLCYLSVFLEIPNSEGWQVFVQEWLVFVVVILVFAVEFIISKMTREKYKDVEWVPLVTEKGDVIGQAPRPLVHNGSCWLHPVVHLHVFDGAGRLLLQLRPAHKKIQPLKWDTAVGGHMAAGEKLDESLKREAREEIGLVDFVPIRAHTYVWKSPVEHEYVLAFKTVSNGPFKPEIEDEVEDLRYWTIDELREELDKSESERNITPNLAEELKRLSLV